jgi:CHAD domain-containing protein
MARKNKWLEGVKPAEPASAAATIALRTRLELLWELLPPAALESHKDIEHVHQLRVATRRAMAALEIFGEFVPHRRAKWFRKQLKRVRRSAGDARDLDVLIARVRAAASNGNGPCVSPLLLRRLDVERHVVQAPIVRIYRRLQKKHWPRRLARLLDRVGWRPENAASNGSGEPTFSAFACRRLRTEAGQFFASATGDFSDLDELHRFRIEGKRLRYTLELFAGACGDALRDEIYPAIEELQERLGRVNDHLNAARRFDAWTQSCDEPELQAALGCWRDEERKALHAAREQFSQWWTADGMTALRDRFDQALAVPALRAD